LLPPDFAQAKKYLTKTSDVYIRPLSDSRIVGYRIFPDVAGNPGLIARTILPRVIYQQGKHTVYFFTIIFAITAIILALSMLILLERTVLIRLLKLYKTVFTIGKNKDIKARITLIGKDELGTLAKAINTMLDSLNEAIAGKRESEERFKNVADSAPVLIWMAGTDRKCTYVNKAWVEFTGFSLEQEIGDGWQDVIHPDDKTDFLAGYASVFEKQIPYEKEIRLKGADGQYRWISVHVVPSTTKDKTLVGCLGAGTDITDLKESTGQVTRINQVLAGREIALAELKKENEALKIKNQELKNIKI
jgi:PAS domain S-box-containing protein